MLGVALLAAGGAAIFSWSSGRIGWLVARIRRTRIYRRLPIEFARGQATRLHRMIFIELARRHGRWYAGALVFGLFLTPIVTRQERLIPVLAVCAIYVGSCLLFRLNRGSGLLLSALPGSHLNLYLLGTEFRLRDYRDLQLQFREMLEMAARTGRPIQIASPLLVSSALRSVFERFVREAARASKRHVDIVVEAPEEMDALTGAMFGFRSKRYERLNSAHVAYGPKGRLLRQRVVIRVHDSYASPV